MKTSISKLFHIDGFRNCLFMEKMISGAVLILVFIFIATNVDIGIWKDEIYTLNASNPVNSFFFNHDEYRSGNFHLPLYYVALQAWFEIFPFTDISARVLGIMLLSTSLFISFILLRSHDRVTALRFVLLVASSYWVIYFALEIRMYVLLVSISNIAAVCLYKIYAHKKMGTYNNWDIYLLNICFLLLTVTHIYGLFISAAIVATLFFIEDFKKFKYFYLVTVIIGILIFPIYFQIINNGLAYFDHYQLSSLVGHDLLSVMMTDIFHNLFVAFKSKVIFSVTVLAILFCVFRSSNYRLILEIRHYLMPIIFVIGFVVVASYFVGAIYKPYAMTVFIPFIFMALTVIISHPKLYKQVSSFLFIGLIIANIGSIPFFTGIPTRSHVFSITDNIVIPEVISGYYMTDGLPGKN